MARYALVIGIAEYVSPSLPRLSKTTNDAEAIAQLLEQYGDFQSVQKLPQGRKTKVTEAEIGQELRKLLLEKAKNNEALIYFSGHGFITSDTLGQQEGFLATSDCQVEVKGNQIVAQKYGISLNKLNKLIGESQLSSLIVLLDCCHSGYFLERELVEQTLTAFRSLKDYYLIAACRRFEQAAAILSEEYSIFTGAVIKGLASENAGSSGRISSDRLFDFVSNELIGSIQEPIRMSLGRPITLVSYPKLDILKEEIAFNQENPYRGLYAFESEQAQYFCGRDEAVRTLVSRLAESRFLAVIGYSGSGKSSLVKAGVLPQLKSDRLPGSSKWAIASFTPGEHPYGKLFDILARQQQQNQPHILFIDQFEEIFTLCQDDEERKAFIRLVTEEVKTTERQTRIILTIRGDFLKRCNEYLEIITLINSTPPTSFLVPPMSFSELEEAIEKPAKLHGVNFEHGLMSQIMNDVVTRPGALPILQYALKELWRVCIEEPESPEPLLTRKGYEEIGAVKEALDKQATNWYQGLMPLNQAFARRLFMELVQLSETGEVTRRRANWERLESVADSPQQLQNVVGALAGSEQRLIITDQNTVEVAHEALLSEWKLLNSWIAENLENIRLSRSLEVDCQEWVQRFNKSDDALLTGAKLAVISEWVNKTQPRLTPLEEEFLHKSLERRDREIQDQLEQERQLRELAESRQKEAEARAIAEIEKSIAAEDKAKAEAARAKEAETSAKYQKQRTSLAIASACGLTLLTIFIIGFGIRAEQNKNKALEALISEPIQLFETNNQLEAMIASIKVLKEFRKMSVEDDVFLNKLKASVIDNVRERNRLEGHTQEVMDVSFSPNGEIIASASVDASIKLWNKNGKFIKYLEDPNKKDIESISFSLKDPVITSSSADNDGMIRLWNINSKSKRELKPQTLSPDNYIVQVSFSPDGKMIASANWDKTVKLWQVVDGRLLHTFSKHNNVVWEVNFSPDGKIIASASEDKTVKLWQVVDGRLLHTLKGHLNAVMGVSFSPNGKMIASASKDTTVKLWRVADGKLLHTFTGHKNYVNKVRFSPNGEMIASASKDTTVKLWRVADGKLLHTFTGHKNGVNNVSFSPDGQTIVSASDDNTVRIWSLNPIDTRPNVNDLLIKSCNWLKNYLTNNSKLLSAERSICDDI
ncbi:nSTAND1 domain-containing NTPase [Nostoc sp.]|uniref:nSTAND1 domain-containing NTPase n=1 Tax=Nostoc sp. TaxID=1180 RepID=UPI002FFB606E